jgi:hypothetical protein
MVNDQLLSYINTLLKQGYNINIIKDTLIKSGHKINKVETLCNIAFGEFYKDHLNFITYEIDKGSSIDFIKTQLSGKNLSEEVISQLLNYRGKGFLKDYLKDYLYLNADLIKKGKAFFQDWSKLKTYISIMIFMIVISIFLLLILFKPNSSLVSTLESRTKLCDKIVDSNYNILCTSLVSSNVTKCKDITEASKQNECRDLWHLYDFYIISNNNRCTNILDPSLKEFCYQLDNKECNNFFGYGAECLSIVWNSDSFCVNQEPKALSMFTTCIDNYYLYNGLTNNPRVCGQIQSNDIKNLCMALSS